MPSISTRSPAFRSFIRTTWALYSSDDSIITLVTCYPTLYYDHRVLVTAELVGFRV